ncbi:uncharacterized protein LOC112596767 [Melanaphis sacchari]|uniref:uncharacterized protein LOC112596767 n=1 Tax=Melanaphis sacchari TaxID=742174 RepID=UPI000DC14591|nr:uncharacterized protein LOC112596767 [Melanaphis sacchari]
MYFYNVLLLISNILMLTVHAQPQDPKGGVGISACCFDGGRAKRCSLSDVQISKTPETCTAIFYDGVYVDLKYHVYVLDEPGQIIEDDKTLVNLDKILKSSKRVFLYYGYMTIQEWTKILACESCNGGTNSLDEMKGLKAFLDEHPGIAGLIISGLEYDYDSPEFPGFSENLKTYLEVMKKSFPDLIIGLVFTGGFPIDQYTNPMIPWLDINVIDSAVDFYVISFMCFNDCTEDFRGGIAPMTASNTNYTMDKLKDVLKQASIPKEKTHFKFRISPTSDPNDSLTNCDLTTEQICLRPQETCTWCVDSQTSFNEKGKFSKEYGAGFVASLLDFNDPDNCCNCEKPYPGFNALLDGFNGVTTKPCALLNRN